MKCSEFSEYGKTMANDERSVRHCFYILMLSFYDLLNLKNEAAVLLS